MFGRHRRITGDWNNLPHFRHNLRVMSRSVICSILGMALLSPVAALAQSSASAQEPPAIRRWIDLQAVQAGLRYRWAKNSNEVETSDSLQWHGLVRGRFLFDEGAKVSLNASAFSGATYVASWNDTGIGRGDFVGRFRVRHLFLAVEPARGIELQVGGLAPNRGEVSENVSYDMDGYLVGQRATIRPSTGRVTQFSATVGHIGDFAEPGVIKRLDSIVDYNYGQVLIGVRLHPRATASFDYTHEDGLDYLREAVVIRTPPDTKVFTGVRIESYQRVSDNTGWGFNASADLKLGRLLVTGGIMNVDSGYRPINGDRYGSGKRYYSIGTLPVNGDVTLTAFHTHAFGNDRFIPNYHRFDLILVVNPTARLKRAGIF